jgi:hypothetical protein
MFTNAYQNSPDCLSPFIPPFVDRTEPIKDGINLILKDGPPNNPQKVTVNIADLFETYKHVLATTPLREAGAPHIEFKRQTNYYIDEVFQFVERLMNHTEHAEREADANNFIYDLVMNSQQEVIHSTLYEIYSCMTKYCNPAHFVDTFSQLVWVIFTCYYYVNNRMMDELNHRLPDSKVPRLVVNAWRKRRANYWAEYDAEMRKLQSLKADEESTGAERLSKRARRRCVHYRGI